MTIDRVVHLQFFVTASLNRQLDPDSKVAPILEAIRTYCLPYSAGLLEGADGFEIAWAPLALTLAIDEDHALFAPILDELGANCGNGLRVSVRNTEALREVATSLALRDLSAFDESSGTSADSAAWSQKLVQIAAFLDIGLVPFFSSLYIESWWDDEMI
ncbi:hypothetical protein ACWPKO_28695 (plasmid) [Coraliomargarita sp. W4R53]